MESVPSIPFLIAAARFVGIFAPTLYCGFTSSDSLTFVQPIVNHAPNQKIMAKQWYHGYSYGPYWVPPMIAPGTLANIYLALTTANATRRNCYFAAAIGVFSILPITFFYMEPGINGASKWKVQTLLKDEGFHLPDTSIFVPSSVKHGSTQESRRWAERTDMQELIKFWQRVNNFRWAVTGLAAMVSGYATFAL